jgi:hypothetical protein
LAEDGKTVFWAHDLGKNTPPWTAEKTDLATMECVMLGKIPVEHWPNGDFGLVPGGKYFHLGSQIYDRRTLKLVAAREFLGYGLRVIGFSPDGSRYAAMLQKARDSHAKTEALVRVQDTLTGRTVLAFTPPAAVLQFRFSNKGEQLAIAYDDGTLESRAVTVGKAK